MVIDFTKQASVTFPLQVGDAAAYTVGRVRFQIKGAGTYSLVPQILIKGTGTTLSSADAQNTYYTNVLTNASVAAGTAITAAGIYEVDATGMLVYVSGSYTSGACILATQNLIG